jgi:hypothetical protein
MKVNTTEQALKRLKEARDEDYLQGEKPRSDNELIWQYITKLQDEISLLKDELFLN